MLEAFFLFLWEMSAEVAGHALVVLGLLSLAEPFRPARKIHPLFAGLGLLLLGGLMGTLYSLVLPDRLLPRGALPVLSLVLLPVVAGLVMEWYGRWRRGRKAPATAIASFAGGALVAFSFAFVRFWIVSI